MEKKLYLWVVSAMLLCAGCGKNNAIGVIGGADGPTAVFVAGKSISDINWIGIGTVVVFVLVLIAFIYAKLKSK